MQETVQISERQRAVLRRVVEEFVGTGQPVGSKTLVERSDLRVSPSTVRAELANYKKFRRLTTQWVGLTIKIARTKQKRTS